MDNNQPIDVFSLVTDRIMSLLKAGTIPWRQPWKDGGLPHNVISKRPYRGINMMLLNSLDYPTGQYLTWKQLKTISASVKRGEKGHMVVFTKVVEKEKVGGGTEKRSILRYYKVFNVEQCTDIPTPFLTEPLVQETFIPVERCVSIIDGMKDAPQIQHKKQEAYYTPSLDIINMPKPKSFGSPEEYYCTLFHELVHSTGHAKRLNRREIADDASFGSQPYSIEELVAEVGACYLNAYAGIPNKTVANSAAYIDHWLGVLKQDKRFIIKAASRSQQAVEYILNTGSTATEKAEDVLDSVEG